MPLPRAYEDPQEPGALGGVQQVKSSQSLFKHGKIHQEFKKLKIT